MWACQACNRSRQQSHNGHIASDIDVVKIPVSMMYVLEELGLQDLLVAFGHEQKMRWIHVHVHDLYYRIAEKSKGMFFFHAFTGCDVVSAFRWQTWDFLASILLQ